MCVALISWIRARPARAAARRLAEKSVDSLLVLQSMAVPPAYTLQCLDLVPGIPLVIWAIHRTSLSGTFDHSGITAEGATVGAPMLTSCLIARRRYFDLVLGRLDDSACVERVQHSIRAASAAGSLRRARVGRVGNPQDGYDFLVIDADHLRRATGIELVVISPAEVLDRWHGTAGRTESLAAEITGGWDLAPDVEEGESLERSLRLAIVLEELTADYRLDAGAMNCHVPEIRFGEEIGITPCYALGRLTTRGIPWTCTGDVPTAIAMLTVKRLGGATLYHELEAVDYESGELVIANSGEHDLGWCAPDQRPCLRRNGWFQQIDRRCGVCACFGSPAGPATLVAFVAHPDASGGYRYVAAPGELTGRQFPSTGTANGAFRFASGPVEEAWTNWARAGAFHHSCATLGNRSEEITLVARHLGVDARVV